jgi:hypothetical protein
MSASLGGGKSKSKQSSSSTSYDYGNEVWGAQSPYLQDMYARAQQMSMQPAQGMGSLGMAGDMYGQSGNMYGQSMGYLGQAGNAFGQSQDALNRMANPTEADPMQAVYARQLGQQFNEQIMPGLKGDAMVGGGMGGSRAGIAQGLAGARMGQQLQDFSAQLYGQQQERALRAGQALQGVGQGYLQGMAGLQENAAGYGSLGQAYQGLATQQQQMPWAQMQQYAGLLGPAVMRDLGGYSTSRSKGKSNSWNMNMSGGLW